MTTFADQLEALRGEWGKGAPEEWARVRDFAARLEAHDVTLLREIEAMLDGHRTRRAGLAEKVRELGEMLLAGALRLPCGEPAAARIEHGSRTEAAPLLQSAASNELPRFVSEIADTLMPPPLEPQDIAALWVVGDDMRAA